MHRAHRHAQLRPGTQGLRPLQERTRGASKAAAGEIGMTYILLKYAHILGAILIGGGLIGVWVSDLRSRQLRELNGFAEAVRAIAVFYDGVVVPGAIILLISGTWLIAKFFGCWDSIKPPWLVGMVILFAFE